jgi:hypothetical protein
VRRRGQALRPAVSDGGRDLTARQVGRIVSVAAVNAVGGSSADQRDVLGAAFARPASLAAPALPPTGADC